MLSTDTTTADALRSRFPDAIVTDADPGWDAARMSFNVLVDQRPEAVARPRSAAEAAEIVRAAREAGLRVHAQGSSHNTGPVGSLEGTLLVRLDRTAEVTIDAEAGVARVEAGARWWDVVPRASELGLSALHGSSPEINVVGYSLGGGLGWQARKRGLQANSLTAIEVVTAVGERLRVDDETEPDLYWALRGGSGNFAVVTAVEFRLYPVDGFYAGAMFFPLERAADVLHTWREWTRTAPEEVTSAARVMQFPPLEAVPEVVRGKAFAIVDAAYLGGEADGAELFEPLRALGPAMDTFGMVPAAGLSGLHMDPVEPVPFVSTHALLGDLEPRAIDEAVATVSAGGPPIFELRHTGGATGRAPEAAGAIASLPGEYMMFAGSPVMDPAHVPEIEARLALTEGAFASQDVGRYLNFTEVASDVARMFPPATLERLRRVKAAYDPDDAIRANHEIG